MTSRLPTMLKDAAFTVLVAAALGIFVVGFRTLDVGSRTGLSFDYEFVDLGVALIVIFFGRLGLSLAASGLRWPAIALGGVMIALGASPLRLPSGFLHWFVVLGGVLLVIRDQNLRTSPTARTQSDPAPDPVLDWNGSRWYYFLALGVLLLVVFCSGIKDSASGGPGSQSRGQAGASCMNSTPPRWLSAFALGAALAGLAGRSTRRRSTRRAVPTPTRSTARSRSSASCHRRHGNIRGAPSPARSSSWDTTTS
jgi:hypothetical protein